ncbi:F-actin-monooxygenase Mical isoform X2 [Coccinella septempunctata]|uniref:F-actin-monooxygenase Mical isoform X2 n=1 Tax=Coccinella septempunctata TaxID=41139 RepID=UPI001D06F4F7|nr:F-actin-monooxygenase Mical isoform X2 [Coccinella septempunctata]
MFHGDTRTTGTSKAGTTISQAQALEYFEQFMGATTLKNILGYFRTMCELIHLKPTYLPLFYPKLKAMLNGWKAKAIWKKLDSRANHKCYGKGKIGEKTRVLVIGGGPCGLRTAIEAQLLGCKVVVVEKRDRLSRNNVLHLWPFVIEDLRALGAKKFFGKFCAGAIDHISIRQLQCILLKVALVLGVEIHTEVSFESLVEPSQDEKIGWRAQVKPSDHPVSQYEFDVIIGADGKRNTLTGFKRKEFRGKLAIAITANFINKRTEAEARVEEISGVAFIFNQKFFKDLYHETGIDLENIVYYKDETHYFVMTAKKTSLIEKGVILQDLAETERLLAPDNVNREALLNYAKEAADFSTNYQMSNMEFAVNHYGQPDVAMFDFTSMYAAENASKVLERNGYQLLMILVGDSLLEPFWPTGSGCARGFLSSLDAAWAIRTWSLGKASPLEVLAERESTYRLLAQTTPDNLNKDWKSYTLDPSTRYPNLNRATVTPHQLVSLYDTDDIQNIEKLGQNVDKVTNISRKRRREIVDSEILIEWVKRQVESHPSIKITDLSSIFHSGKVLCAIINHYRPDLIDYSSIVNNEATQNNQLAIDVLEKDIGISPIMTGQEITSTQDNLALTAYLTQIYDVFKSEIPHVKHPKLRNIWTISDLAVPKQSLESYSLSVNSPNDSGVAIKKSQSESMNKLVMKYSTSTLTTDFSGDDSIFKLYPYFLSTKPSECGTETDLHQEKEISFKDPVEQCQELQAIETAKAMSIKNTSTEMPRKMLTQFPGNFSFKLRSKLVQKKCSLKKSVRNFQDQFQIQELEFNTSNLADGSRELYFIEILDKKRKFSPFFKPSRTTLIMTANTSYPTKVIRTEKSNDRCVNGKCRIPKEFHINFSSDPIMCDAEEKESISPEQVFSRVSNWIESNDFEEESESTEVVNNKTEPIETNIEEGFSDITSITKCLEKKSMGKEKKLIVGELFDSKGDISKQDEEKFPNKLKALACNQMFKTLGKLSHFTLFPNEAKLESPAPFSVIMEGQESELPESKNTVTSFKTLLKEPSAVIASNVASRPSSRHKRHVEGILSNKSANIERKTRKRRTLDKSGSVAEIQKQFEEGNSSKSSRLSKRQQQRKRHAEHFIKSMQMLAANAKPDCPFEDYSIFVYRQTARNFEDRVKDLEKKFTYIPEYDTKVPSLIRTNTDDEFAAKIKSIEEGWQSRQLVEKKPKDLMRKIGKIETSDWNIKEIEKKIKENKLGKPIVRDKEKVPKWSREQFVARQTKLEKLDRQDSAEAKYADIDKNLKHLELKLKEGTNRDLGQNKIASITEKLTSKIPEPPEPVVPKSVDKPVIIPSYSGSEFCHFCNKRVYLMERLSAEGRFFHHGCFKCQYCRAQLRLGSYAFDKDGIYGHKFFCLHHYGMQGKAPTTTKVARKPSQRDTKPTSKKLTGVSGVDLLDRVRTPERAEFSNLSLGSSDLEDSISQMDEDEWTDRNFGASTAEIGSSDDEDDSSSYSDTDSDDEDAYEEAMEEPATKEGTLKWAERMSKRHYSKQDKSDSEPYGSSDSSSYYENSTDDDESDTATEGEEEIRARELRLQEVRLEPPIIQADTGTDTEVKCNLKTSDNLNLSHSETQCSDPRFSQNSSSNSINSTDFDSALEDNFDINFNNVISKNEVNAPINHSSIDSGDDSATISRSEPNSNVTVIERTLDKNVDNSDCIIDENNKQIPRSSQTISASLENNEVVLTEVCDSTVPNGKNSQSEENCVSPSIKMSKKFFGSAFVPTFQKEEPEPLLVIKRTPSKINLPKEVGKPKVAVNKNIEENAKKYFGAPPKPTLRRSSTARNIPKPKVSDRSYFKSSSLNSNFSFNFEPEEEDLKNTDDYIEQLLKNEKELMKPIDPDKFRRLYETDENEQKKSDSIDDLLEALEMETYDDVFEHSVMKEKDEKIEKLLQWMDDVVHQEDNIKVPGKLKGDSGKYDNLEAILKTEKTAAPVAKLAKNNIKYFDELLAGKNSEAEDEVPARKFSWTRNDVDNHLAKHRTSLDLDAIKKVNIKNVLRKFESMDYTNDDERANIGGIDHVGERKKPSLTRSKTEIHFNKPRTSVDLDAVSKVDIKQVLKKFENADKKEDSPVLPRRRSSSFANFKKSNLKVKDDPKKCSDEKIAQNSRVTNIQNEYSENGTKKNSSSDPIEKTPEKCQNETDSFFNIQVKVNYEQYPMEYTNSYEPDLKVYPNEDATNILGISDKDMKSISESQVEEADSEIKNQQQNICEITSQNNPVFKPEECEGDAINNIANIQNCRNENTQNEISSKKNSDSLTKHQILSEYDPKTTFKNESSIQSNEIITSDVIPPEEKYDSGSAHSEKEIKDQENETNTDTNKEELGKLENIIPVLEYKVFDKIQQDLDEMIGSLNDMDNTNRKSLVKEVEEPAQIESSKTSKTVTSNLKNNDIIISHSDSKNINEGETNIRCDESDKPDTLENEPKKENIKSDIEKNGTNYEKLERIENNNNNFSLLKQEVFDEIRKISDSIHTENGIKNQEKETNTHTNKEEVGKTENIIPVVEHKVFDKIQQDLDEMVGSLNDMVATNEESLDKEKTSGGVLNEEIDTFKKQLNAKNTDTTTEIPVLCCDKSPINENMSYDAHINSEKSVFSDENSSDASSEIQNSATEISTDSEFAQDDPTPTSEVPAILLNDLYINTTRGSSSNRPKKIQVTSGFLQKPSNGKALKQDIELKLTPLVSPAPSLRKLTSSIKPPSEPYALNRTQSTGGIATKVSLELKKKYLLGESIGGSGGGNIQKSGSASTLDTKLKSFCSNISDCQKLLKPAPEISASMQTFCKKLDENISPILSPLTVKTFSKPTSPIESNENEENKNLPPPDLINVTVTEKKEEKDVSVFENETEGRPRSPLHETSLIVPEIDWKKVSHCAESLSSSSTTSSSSDEQIKTPNLSHKNIPTVEVCEVEDCQEIVKNSHETSQKSISSDKKQLNQPKTLPGLKTDAKKIPQEAGYQKMLSQDDRSSACSTPISVGDDMTNAFTETELSDWARDGGVSDDLEGVAFDLNEEEPRKQTIPDLHTIGHICGKTEEENEKEPLSANFDSIEFMDTCTESNSEEGVVNSITYNILNNEEIAEDSLNPIINNIVEAQNTVITEMKIKNSGYCIIASDNNNFGGKVVNLRPADVEHLKQNQNLCEREEDSLLVVETTTEENTCSDSTVKNVTEIPKDFNSASNTQKQRLEEKLSQLKKEKEDILLQARIEKEIEKKEKENETKDIRNIEFDEHCQRLQSKVDFGNVKDSIDIRKSRRRSKDSPQKPDFIQEEKQCLELKNSLKDITLNLSPTIKTPDQIYNKEVIEKERNVNQRLVQEMVMSKMRAENKALDRKIRNRPTTNILNKTVQLSKSATADIAKMNMGNLDNSMKRIVEHTSGNFVLKEKEPIVGMSSLQKSQTSPNVLGDNRSIYDLEITPIAPPRSKDLKNATDKLKSEARARAKMLSNEELGLSPEDKLLRLREKSRRYERSANSECSEFQLYPTALNSQTPVSSKDASRKSRPISEYLPKYDNRKSFSPVGGKGNDKKMCRSDSNLFRTVNDKDKVKDESPKKGIKFTKIMDLFSKKSPKGLFSKISPKSKDVSKSCPTLFEWTPMTTEKVSLPKGTKMKGVQEVLPQRSSPEIPPPVPPLPLCYTESLLRRSDSSDDDFKCSKKSSSENLGGPVNLDDSVSSLTERHSCKRSRRSVREAQLKRHRMAQEIQRKLEETEVKTKELEDKGVMIEKALRGEDGEGSSKQESELLQEWFDIMRDRTELRRYEKELMVRAQELELEDRHARLQHQLRKRLKEENKSEEDKEIDYKIINEMLEIVSKRDSLIALLEEDRLRYLSEDRDFEEQMLAKDLHLTPKWKTSEK